MTPPTVFKRNGITATLYFGDCLEVLPTIGRVDATIADPPYGVWLKGKKRKDNFRPGTYCHIDSPEYVKSVCVKAVRLCRKISDRVIITPGSANAFSYPKPNDIGCFFNSAGTGTGKWGFVCMHLIFYYGIDPYTSTGKGSRPSSIANRGMGKEHNQFNHPCAKPLDWMRWLVARSSFERQTILDPFMGSGTTGLAAVSGNRNFIGIEIDRRWFDVACERIDAEMCQEVLL